MPDFQFSTPGSSFIDKIEEALEKAIEERRWNDARAYTELRDWFVYNKRVDWLPSLELIETL